MLTPLIGFILGLIIIIISILIYLGKFTLLSKQLRVICQGNNLVLIGINLIAIALMLGLLGFALKLNVQFRYIRLLFFLIGLILVRISLANNLSKLTNITPFLLFLIKINNRQLLQGFAGIIILFLAIKSVVAVDVASGDTWMYQLPFSARFWGLISPEQYTFEAEREPFYGTSTMLPNILQGFFWRLFGTERPQGANLVSFLSLIGYFVFVKYYLKIPLYLSIITILAVPLIHIAATSCYVDLFGNIGLSITLIMTYLLYLREDFITAKNISIFILGGFIAANTKYLLVPPLAIIMAFVFLRILWLIIFRWCKKNKNNLVKQILVLFITMGFANIIIFATEFKNLLFYQNPFYPIKVSILGHDLNHIIVPTSTYMSEKIQTMSPIQRWLYSLLEIGAFDDRRPWHWTIAMDYVPLDADSFGMGGYFGIYIIFNICLFIWLCFQVKSNDKKIALGLVIIISIFTPFLPFAYQLRYYMYWIITLITLSLYLSLKLVSLKKNSWFKVDYLGYIGVIIMLIFGILTRWDYTYPSPFSLAKFMNEERVNPEILANIKENESVCLVGFTPLTFLYNSQFHQGKNYSLKAEFNLSKEDVIKNCEKAGFKKIIYKQ